MNPTKVMAIALIAIAQIFLFVIVWDWINNRAVDSGRPVRGGVAFGVTLVYGKCLLSALFVIATTATMIFRKAIIVNIVLVTATCAWSIYTLPMMNQYPNRGTSLMLLGIGILIGGSGIFGNVLSRRLNSAE